jgi:hypothetical protein
VRRRGTSILAKKNCAIATFAPAPITSVAVGVTRRPDTTSVRDVHMASGLKKGNKDKTYGSKKLF